MKRSLLITTLSTAFLIATSGCTKKSAGDYTGPTPLTGDWKITYYNNGTDVTADYAAYTFDFKPKNALTSTINDQTSDGYWAISTKEGGQKLNIGFNTGDDKLSEISDDWQVVSVSQTEIKLIDENDATHAQIQFDRQ